MSILMKKSAGYNDLEANRFPPLHNGARVTINDDGTISVLYPFSSHKGTKLLCTEIAQQLIEVVGGCSPEQQYEYHIGDIKVADGFTIAERRKAKAATTDDEDDDEDDEF